MTLPIGRNELLDKRNRFKKVGCGLNNVQTERFAVFDKKALPYIKAMVDKEPDRINRDVMERIYCLQLYSFDNDSSTYRAFNRVLVELSKLSRGFKNPLWFSTDIIVQKEDADVIKVSKNLKAKMKDLESVWRSVSMDEYMRDAVGLDYEDCRDIWNCFSDLANYGQCFYNENVISVLKSNGFKYSDGFLESYKKYFARRFLALKKKLSQELSKTNLAIFQKLPLAIKIAKTRLRIREWYEHWNGEVYISVSGGKDSKILQYLVHLDYPDVPCVFVDTGLEHPLVREFAMSMPNVTVLKPKMSFYQVIKRHGYPIISKSQSMAIRKLTTQNLSYEYRNKLLYGDEKGDAGRLSNKWHYLLDAPFKISEKCCDIMKKDPIHEYEKKTGRKPFIGTMAIESPQRQSEYLEFGCNAFDKGNPQSTPIGFWTEQDVLRLLRDEEIPYSEAYGEIVETDGKLTTTKEKRTGCLFCAYGAHLETGETRFQRMARELPALYAYCMDKLNMRMVLDYIGVKYELVA